MITAGSCMCAESKPHVTCHSCLTSSPLLRLTAPAFGSLPTAALAGLAALAALDAGLGAVVSSA